MKLLKYINIVVILVAFVACDRDELLDVKPKGVELPETVEHYRLLMDQRNPGSYSVGFMKGHLNDMVLSDDIKALDGLQGRYVGAAGRTVYSNALSWEDHLCGIDEEDPDWKNLYNIAYVCNVVLEKLAEIEGDEAEIAQLIAEAKVHRAYAHYILVNFYAKHYNASTAASDLGVVIQTSSAFESLVRGTVQQTYDLILSDLDDALNTESLPDMPSMNVRPSKASANALLARVYLMMGDYANAKIHADNCLGINNVLYDYNNLSVMPDTWENEELLLEKQYGSYPPGTYYAPDELLALYDMDNDIRYSKYFQDDYSYPGEKAYVPWYYIDYYVGPTVAEMYLIRAECNARTNNEAAAIADLNTLRENRYIAGSYVAYTSADEANALQLAKDERRRELAGRGARWFDLKRYNQHDNANISLTRTFDGYTYTLEANSPKWVLPIARKYIQMNPELEQNPRE